MGAAEDKKYDFNDTKISKLPNDTKISNDLKKILNQHFTNTNDEITTLKKEISNIADTLNDYENNIISKINALKKETNQDVKNITENLNQRENNKITALEIKIDALKKYIKNNFIKVLLGFLVISFISIFVSLSIFSNNRISIKRDEISQNITTNQNNTPNNRAPSNKECIDKTKLRDYINNQPVCE